MGFLLEAFRRAEKPHHWYVNTPKIYPLCTASHISRDQTFVGLEDHLSEELRFYYEDRLYKLPEDLLCFHCLILLNAHAHALAH